MVGSLTEMHGSFVRSTGATSGGVAPHLNSPEASGSFTAGSAHKAIPSAANAVNGRIRNFIAATASELQRFMTKANHESVARKSPASRPSGGGAADCACALAFQRANRFPDIDWLHPRGANGLQAQIGVLVSPAELRRHTDAA